MPPSSWSACCARDARECRGVLEFLLNQRAVKMDDRRWARVMVRMRGRVAMPSECVMWLVPAVAGVLLAWTGLAKQDVSLFLALNRLAARLPDTLWSCVTTLGDTLVAFVILLPVLRVRPQMALAALIASIPAGLMSRAVKFWLDIDRPAHVLTSTFHIIGPKLMQGSFPSGHTTTAFVLAAVVIAGLRSRRLAAAVALMAIMVGASRVAVGAHWPSDVAGGALVGWLSGTFGVWFVRRCLPQPPAWQLKAFRLLLVGCAVWLLVAYDSRYPLARPFHQVLAVGALVLTLAGRSMIPRGLITANDAALRNGLVYSRCRRLALIRGGQNRLPTRGSGSIDGG
jgi:membrane-associated phospholipid phosphatase